jgi:hypothetical protein
MQLRIAMQPLSEDELLIAGMGTGKRETVRVVERQGERRLAVFGTGIAAQGPACSGAAVDQSRPA